MTLTEETRASIRRLDSSVEQLLSMINEAIVVSAGKDAPGLEDAVGIVQLHRSIMKTGYSDGDVGQMLRGANLLTTTNKGIGDIVAAATVPHLGEQAFEVTKRAIEAANCLLSDQNNA